MKSALLSLILLSLSLTAFAKNVELQIKIKHQVGEKVKATMTTVIAALDKEWEVPYTDDKSFKIKMNVTDKFEMPKTEMKKGMKAFKMSGKVFSKENGAEVLVASPEVIVENKKEALFKTVNDQNDKTETFEMTIIPTAKL